MLWDLGGPKGKKQVSMSVLSSLDSCVHHNQWDCVRVCHGPCCIIGCCVGPCLLLQTASNKYGGRMTGCPTYIL